MSLSDTFDMGVWKILGGHLSTAELGYVGFCYIY